MVSSSSWGLSFDVGESDLRVKLTKLWIKTVRPLLGLGVDHVVLGCSSGCLDFSILVWAWTPEWPPRCAPRGRCLVPSVCCRYQIQNPFLTAQSTQIKSVISVPIKDFIHHYPRALFNDIPRVGTPFYDIPGSGCSLTTYHWRSTVVCWMTCLTWWAWLGGGVGAHGHGGVIQEVQIQPLALQYSSAFQRPEHLECTQCEHLVHR